MGADRVYKDIKSKMLFSIWKNRIWKRVQITNYQNYIEYILASYLKCVMQFRHLHHSQNRVSAL